MFAQCGGKCGMWMNLTRKKAFLIGPLADQNAIRIVSMAMAVCARACAYVYYALSNRRTYRVHVVNTTLLLFRHIFIGANVGSNNYNILLQLRSQIDWNYLSLRI